MKKRSFTLIELLVVTAIILVLTASILPNFRGIGKEFALQRSANKLAQDLRRAEQMTLSAREFKEEIPKGGYGIYLNISENSHYILFADLSGNYQYDGKSELVEDIKLEKKIKIKNLSSETGNYSSLNIVFTPPDPKVTITPSDSQAFITICLESNLTKTKTIGVNKAGLIYVE